MLDLFSKTKIEELLTLVDSDFHRKQILVNNLAPKSLEKEREKNSEKRDFREYKGNMPVPKYDETVMVGKRTDHAYKAEIDRLKQEASGRLELPLAAHKVELHMNGNNKLAVRIQKSL